MFPSDPDAYHDRWRTLIDTARHGDNLAARVAAVGEMRTELDNLEGDAHYGPPPPGTLRRTFRQDRVTHYMVTDGTVRISAEVATQLGLPMMHQFLNTLRADPAVDRVEVAL